MFVVNSSPYARSCSVKKKKKHTKKHKRDDVVSGGGAGDGRPDDTTEEPAGEAEVDAVRVKGTGRITSSGTVIHGLGTKFMHEFKPGDGLEISHPTSCVPLFDVLT